MSPSPSHDHAQRVETMLARGLSRVTAGPGAPPKLVAAMRHAVLGGGARLRPKLCLAVAEACGVPANPAVEAAAMSLEFLHCASLVHDDLPCFDDADLRRGRPSVQAAFGEALAVLTGDALITGAFELLAHPQVDPHSLGPLLGCVARAVGASRGIVAGQAWECEPRVGLAHYHQAKTGALFEASAQAGAIVAGDAPAPWARFGGFIGEAYQVADDLHDTLGGADLGKPSGQDGMHGRPNAVLQLGLAGALERLEQLLDRALDAVPPCEDRRPVDDWLATVATRLNPSGVQMLPARATDAMEPVVSTN